MRTTFVTLSLCAYFALAFADVSHLSSSYLPPAKPEQVEHMTIEQHELRELPEQVDYMHEIEQHGDMELMPSSQLTPPAMPEQEQMLSSRYLPPAQPAMPESEPAQMPAARYLPPAQPAMPAAEQMSAMPAARYLPPAQPTQRAEPEPEPMLQPEMMPEPAMEYMAPVEPQPQAQPQAAPAMRYLPPAQAQNQEYAYQPYQEQLQQQQQEQQMPYILDVQQPMAPSDAETLAFEAEPEPAHELRNDGYHYKQAEEEQQQRFRH